MPTYTQAGRPLTIKTPLPNDELLLVGLEGHESISRPFSFQLDLMSENRAVDPKALLRKPSTITILLPDDDKRHINGLVSRISQGGVRDDLAFYRAELVPWFWFLSLSRDCKMFQNLSVPDIIEQVFKARGFTDYKMKTTASYPKREYVVQYRETDFNFVSRLMEEEGIFYFFEHTQSKHTMVLADKASMLQPCPGESRARVAQHAQLNEDIITEIEREDAVYIGKVTLRDYDPLQPSLSLHSTMSGNGKEEIYEYQPVIYTKVDEGERYARIQLEAEEALQKTIRGRGTCRSFQSGYRFDLEEHYRSDMNGAYLLTHVQHAATAGDYRTWENAPFDYTNDFVCIPSNLAYRPPRTAQKPVMRGSQTAIVVGKSGEEIWTDKHGRVKVQFHWDRDGKKDENSSCWVRVSSVWAGKNWGAVHIPRIGQEVIVDFLEGDPDRPIITGRVYNAEQVPPYGLPANQTQSGIKSRSSKGGGAEHFNEIRFEDKKGSEQMYVHAEKDKMVVIENDRTESVGHDEKITIEHDRIEEVKNDETIKIGVNRTEEVGGDETIKIAGSRKEEVAGHEDVTIKGNRTHKIEGNDELDVGGNRDIKIGGDDKQKVDANLTLEVGANIKIKAGAKIVIEAPAGIELKVGGSKVKITPAGVDIEGPMINLKGQAMVKLKAAMVQGQGDALVQIKAPIAQVNGDGIVKVQGGITMIN